MQVKIDFIVSLDFEVSADTKQLTLKRLLEQAALKAEREFESFLFAPNLSDEFIAKGKLDDERTLEYEKRCSFKIETEGA